MLKHVTIRDVAALASTSVSTVSAAFAARGGVAPDTRDRVFAAADALGWRPDRRASRLRRNQSAALGVAYEVTQAFQAALVDSIYLAARNQQIDVILAGATENHSEIECLRLLLMERCDGLLLTGGTLPEEFVATAAKQMPVVSLCRQLDIPGVDGVYSDSHQCVGLALDHLIELGHREIWYLGAVNHSMGLPREVAYREAMDSAGLGAVVIEAGCTTADGISGADALLAMESLPTALMCYNDVLAVALVRRLRQRGVSVPGDVSVIGYDNAPVAADPTVELTTVSQPHVQMTEEALRIVAERMKQGHPAGPGSERSVQMAGELVVRETTGPPQEWR